MKLSRMLALLSAALIAVLISLQSPLPAQGQGMDHSNRQGLIGAQTDAERQAFAALACRCGGCPNEALSTCPCGPADGYRNEIRAMIARGMTLEEIKKEWEKRFGPDALTVPPNRGANRAMYVVPFILIVLFAGVVVSVLRHFRKRDEEKNQAAAAAGGAPLSGGAHDEYDDKLDDELKRLDDEE